MNQFSTSLIRTSDKVDRWQEIVNDMFMELNFTRVAKRFYARAVDHELGDIHFSLLDSAGCDVVRSSKEISGSHQDKFYLNLQIDGECNSNQCGRDAHLGAGDFALYDTSQPFELSYRTDFKQLILQIPRHILKRYVTSPEMITSVRVDGRSPAGSIMRTLLSEVYSQTPKLKMDAGDSFAEGILYLLAASLSEQAIIDTHSGSTNQLTLQMRLRQYIEQNLCDPELSVEKTAKANGISMRYARKLFETQEYSIGQWIWQRRLEKCYMDLSNPRCSTKSIAEIAFFWGFNDASHFSRAFKSRYGLSPKEHRNQTLISVN